MGVIRCCSWGDGRDSYIISTDLLINGRTNQKRDQRPKTAGFSTNNKYTTAMRRNQMTTCARMASPSPRQIRCLITNAETMEAKSLAQLRLLSPFLPGDKLERREREIQRIHRQSVTSSPLDLNSSYSSVHNSSYLRPHSPSRSAPALALSPPGFTSARPKTSHAGMGGRAFSPALSVRVFPVRQAGSRVSSPRGAIPAFSPSDPLSARASASYGAIPAFSPSGLSARDAASPVTSRSGQSRKLRY
mmetsp:Transcript_26230/g.59892  ORF Transcript_26230/g.59892 Transcript_26230/m.59892 type:complete len:246 (-) Transcript_26230:282-1019(-)